MVEHQLVTAVQLVSIGKFRKLLDMYEITAPFKQTTCVFQKESVIIIVQENP